MLSEAILDKGLSKRLSPLAALFACLLCLRRQCRDLGIGNAQPLAPGPTRVKGGSAARLDP